MTTSGDSIQPFEVKLDPEEISDLRRRLEEARWPDQLPGAGWDYGTEQRFLRSLCEYWRGEFDWSAFKDRFNGFDQHVTRIDDQLLHFYHVRSPEPSARPLLLSHGWPGSVAEFLDVLGPLADPAAHGGDPADAFHVVAPSLPGYGFSGPTREQGYDAERIASVFAELMERIGYDRYFAQGGDWGALITALLASNHPDRVEALHTNMLFVSPSRLDDPMGMLDEEGLDDYRETKAFLDNDTAYLEVQSSRPQTLAYGLTDSPVGLAGWLVDLFRRGSDSEGGPGTSFGRDRLLDNVSVYWLTGTINSSMRLYYETDLPESIPEYVGVPTGHARYPAEMTKTPRVWAEEFYDIVRWTEMPEGGHFAAMEVPGVFVDDVRSFFRRFRT